MNDLTHDEMNLICIYSGDNDTREGVIRALTTMRAALEPDEMELLALTDSAVAKLTAMTDAEYAELELFPDFGEDGADGE